MYVIYVHRSQTQWKFNALPVFVTKLNKEDTKHVQPTKLNFTVVAECAGLKA